MIFLEYLKHEYCLNKFYEINFCLRVHVNIAIHIKRQMSFWT